MSFVVETEVVIQNRLGLHARPAAAFVKITNRYNSEITVSKNGFEVNGKSIMGVMMLGASQGSQLRWETSQQVRKRVIEARNRQLDRQYCLNAKMTNQQIEQYCELDQTTEQLLLASIDKLKLTARSYHKILRLARTIADMADELNIRSPHLAEAIAYRKLDKRWNAA